MMHRNDIAYLIHEEKTQDNAGVWHKEEKKRKIFCTIKSVNQREWFEGGRMGLNPELVIRMFCWDYNDEEIVETSNGKRYTVYRTFLTDNEQIELYLQFKKGNANGS